MIGMDKEIWEESEGRSEERKAEVMVERKAEVKGERKAEVEEEG